MAAIAKKLAPEEIGRISAWLAAQPVPAGAKAGGRIRGAACRWPAAALPPRARSGRRDEAAPGALGIAGLAALGMLVALVGVVAWLNLLGEERLGPPAAARRRQRRPPRARRGAHPGRRLHQLPHRARRRALRRRPGDRDAVRQRLRVEPHPRPGHRPRPLVGRRVLARSAPRPLEERAAALSGVPVSELHTRVAGRCRRDVRLPAEPAGGGAAEPRAHASRFPFGTQAALAVWRALYFRPAVHVDDPARSAEWNRGAYLVEGLGHCNACHSARNALGATRGTLDLQGGLIPVQNWYAPSLASPREASVAAWPKHEVVQLLKTGIAPQGFVMGPMSEVVLEQHPVPQRRRPGGDGDLPAVAAATGDESDPAPAAAPAAERARRGTVQGPLRRLPRRARRGRARGLSGAGRQPVGDDALDRPTWCTSCSRAAFRRAPPATRARSACRRSRRCCRMRDVAELLSFVRASWGNRAAPVSALDVARARAGRE